MKVCILGPITTKNYFGGVAAFDEDLVMGFYNNGYETSVVTCQKDANKLLNGIVPICVVNSKKEFRKWQEIEKPNLIIGSLAYIRFLSSKRTNTKVIYFLHGYFARNYYGFIKSIFAPLYQKFLAGKADFVFSNSYLTSMINQTFFGIKTDKVIHLGVSEDFLKKTSQCGIDEKERGTILYVGRLVSVKGINRIIDAVKILSERNISYHLIIAGEGPERIALETYAKRKAVNAEFLGRINHEQVIDIYRRSEVFVSLCPSESYGISFAEALLCNCKILCPETGGQIEYLRQWHDSVAFAKDCTAKDIAEGFMYLFKDGRYPTLSEEDRKKYSYKTIATEILNFVSQQQ